MLLLVIRLLKLGASMTNESLCLSQNICSIFVTLAFVPNSCFGKFNSVLYTGRCFLILFRWNVSYIWNKFMDSHFIFWSSFILPPPQQPYHLHRYHLMLFNNFLKLLPTDAKINMQSSILYERWLRKSEHQPSERVNLNWIIIFSSNSIKSQAISLAL